MYYLDKREIIFDKPKHIGFTIHESSKLKMYKTYYKKLQAHFGNNLHIYHMDTDSLVISFDTDDLVTDLKNFQDKYDMSDFRNLRNILNYMTQEITKSFVKSK